MAALALAAVGGESTTAMEHIPLPPGYEYPVIPTVQLPDPLFQQSADTCVSCSGEINGIRLWYKDFAGWRFDLDCYAGKAVTWDFLTFEHGFKSCWTGPQHAIRLYSHSETGVRVVTRQRLVVFERQIDDDGGASLVCISDDDWSIQRDGQRVIVDSPERWWAFETPDFGATWRVVESSSHTFPFPVKLHYEGPSPTLPSAIEYPDGARTRLEPAKGSDAVGRITLPNGIEYHIAYDPNGFPNSLEEYVPREQKKVMDGFTVANVDGEVKQQLRYKTIAPKTALARRWCWENDSLGRIRLMIGPCGNETDISFANHTSQEGTESLTIATDRATGRYRYLRHLEKDATWTIDRGHGPKELPLDQAVLDRRTVQRRIRNEMKVVRIQQGASAEATVIHYAPDGKEERRELVGENGAVVATAPAQHEDAASPWMREANRIVAAEFGGRRITYGYTDKGLLDTASVDGRLYRFLVDPLGRLKEYETPDGARRCWTYWPANLLHTSSLYLRTGSTAADGQPTYQCVDSTSFDYDDWRRLARRQPVGRPAESCDYTCDGLRKFLRHDQRLITFTYRDGRLVRRSEKPLANAPTSAQPATEIRYKYFDDGHLQGMQCLCPGADPQIVWYRYDNEGLRHVLRTEGPVAPADLRRVAASAAGADTFARQARHLNRFGAVIETVSETIGK